MQNLHKMLLHVLSTTNNIAKGILYSEPTVRLHPQSLPKVLRSSWVFPNLKDAAKTLPLMDGHTQNTAVNFIGFIDEYLSK